MFAVLMTAVALAAPPGFAEATAFESAASFVAGKPAAIYCAPTDYAWRSYGATVGASANANAVTIPAGGDESALRNDICAFLRDGLARRPVAPVPFAASLLILVHESIHQRGVHDEGQTECAAIHEMPRVAVKFFHVKAGKQLRALMAAAWVSHRMKPPAYQAVC